MLVHGGPDNLMLYVKFSLKMLNDGKNFKKFGLFQKLPLKI